MCDAIRVEVDLDRDLRLDAFLKICGVAGTGGMAKLMIQDGLVTVNGSMECRRGKRLVAGDEVGVEGIGNFIVAEEE
ncbi:MAG: RNA-binding S4 domain-containing protein [Clostridia bacterium]